MTGLLCFQEIRQSMTIQTCLPMSYGKRLNGLLKSVLGWVTEGDMDKVIQRGRKGLDGLANFVKHFVVKRGVSIGLFEGKLAHLMSELERKRVLILCFPRSYGLPV